MTAPGPFSEIKQSVIENHPVFQPCEGTECNVLVKTRVGPSLVAGQSTAYLSACINMHRPVLGKNVVKMLANRIQHQQNRQLAWGILNLIYSTAYVSIKLGGRKTTKRSI